MPQRIKIIVGLIVILVLLGAIFIISNTDRKELISEEQRLQELKQQVFALPSIENIPDGSYSNKIIEFNEEKGFQVTYIERDDKFNIFIFSITRQGLNSQEFNALRIEIEQYFIDKILKTEDKQLVCQLNVSISTLGSEEPTLSPSPLSFCAI